MPQTQKTCQIYGWAETVMLWLAKPSRCLNLAAWQQHLFDNCSVFSAVALQHPFIHCARFLSHMFISSTELACGLSAVYLCRLVGVPARLYMWTIKTCCDKWVKRDTCAGCRRFIIIFASAFILTWRWKRSQCSLPEDEKEEEKEAGSSSKKTETKLWINYLTFFLCRLSFGSWKQIIVITRWRGQ